MTRHKRAAGYKSLQNFLVVAKLTRKMVPRACNQEHPKISSIVSKLVAAFS